MTCLFISLSQSIYLRQFISMYLSMTVSAYLPFYRGVVVIVVGNGHGDTSSNPGRD